MAQKTALPRLEDFPEYVADRDRAAQWRHRVQQLTGELAEARNNKAIEATQREASVEESEEQLAGAVLSGQIVPAQTAIAAPPSAIPQLEQTLALATRRRDDAERAAEDALDRAALEAFRTTEPQLRAAIAEIGNKLLEIHTIAAEAWKIPQELAARGFPIPAGVLATAIFKFLPRLDLKALGDGAGIGSLARELPGLDERHPAAKLAALPTRF
jgi:hypothetical protein